MKIVVIGPASRDVVPAEERRQNLVDWGGRDDLEIVVARPKLGPASIECWYDVALAQPHVIEEGVRAEQNGADAIIISCFGDVGLYPLREIVNIPVVGAGESAMLVACTVGFKFTVLTPIPNGVPRITKNVALYGLTDRLASVRPLGVPVLGLRTDPALQEKVIQVARKAVRDDCADTILLGCGVLGGMAERIWDAVGVPVIDPRAPALYMAQVLAAMKVTSSRLAYLVPPAKERL